MLSAENKLKLKAVIKIIGNLKDNNLNMFLLSYEVLKW